MTDGTTELAGGSLRALRTMPWWPLTATLAVQTLATMALFSVPTAAPEIAHDLGVPGSLIGVFVSLVYGVGILSAVLSPNFIRRYGAVRVSQAALVVVAGMVLLAVLGSWVSLALGAIVLGLAYGALAPASTHLLVPRTPRRVFNLVMSLRQVGVPLGGVLGALIVPPIAVTAGWRVALLVELAPVLLLLVLLELPRRRWDADRDPRQRLWSGALLRPFRLLRQDPRLRALSVASFVYSGVQLCFIAFMTVQLTSTVRVDLVRAGVALAVYQVAGASSRPIWGWIADRYLSSNQTLALLGFAMAGMALTAGQFGPAWPWGWVLAVAMFSGLSASGFTGVAYAQYARLGGTRGTETTGLGTASMFSGVMLLPSGFGAAVTVLGGYGWAYGALAVLAAGSGLMLCLPGGRS